MDLAACWSFSQKTTSRKHGIKQPKRLKIKGCAELNSGGGYKLINVCTPTHAEWSITIISIMCSLQRSSWTPFVMKIGIISFIAFILKCIFHYWRCDVSCSYIINQISLFSSGFCSLVLFETQFIPQHTDSWIRIQHHGCTQTQTVHNHYWFTVNWKLNDRLLKQSPFIELGNYF